MHSVASLLRSLLGTMNFRQRINNFYGIESFLFLLLILNWLLLLPKLTWGGGGGGALVYLPVCPLVRGAAFVR